MGHELFLTQFEVGESISAIPSIIRGDPGGELLPDQTTPLILEPTERLAAADRPTAAAALQL